MPKPSWILCRRQCTSYLVGPWVRPHFRPGLWHRSRVLRLRRRNGSQLLRLPHHWLQDDGEYWARQRDRLGNRSDPDSALPSPARNLQRSRVCHLQAQGPEV